MLYTQIEHLRNFKWPTSSGFAACQIQGILEQKNSFIRFHVGSYQNMDEFNLKDIGDGLIIKIYPLSMY